VRAFCLAIQAWKAQAAIEVLALVTYLDNQRIDQPAIYCLPHYPGKQSPHATEILKHLDWNAASGYGLETALTFTASKLDWRVQKVHLEGVSHPPSEFHHGLVKGTSNRVKMYWQIGRAWWLLKRK
jgi:hypothetical protein